MPTTDVNVVATVGDIVLEGVASEETQTEILQALAAAASEQTLGDVLQRLIGAATETTLAQVLQRLTGVLLAADATPPLEQLAAGGLNVAGGQAAAALPATAGRIKATVQHTGPTGVLWVRFDGANAAPGVGEAIYPGQQWFEYTAAAVSVYFEGTGSCRVATSELGA